MTGWLKSEMIWGGSGWGGAKQGYLRLDEDLLSGYVFYSALLLLNLLLKGPIVGYLRRKNRAVVADEDEEFDDEVVDSETCLTASEAYPLLRSTRATLSQAVANTEDAAWCGARLVKGDGDPEVERVRRAHLNDLENILAFVLIGGFYVATQSGRGDASCGLWQFRLYTAARLIHTEAYLFAVRQPVRGIAWAVGWLITAAMVAQILYTSATEPLLK